VESFFASTSCYRRFASYGSLQGKLGGLVVEIVNLPLVLCIPLDENRDYDEDLLCLIFRNQPIGYTIHNCFGDCRLGRTEHEYCLGCILIVTLLTIRVGGLVGILGARTARRGV